MNIQLAAHILYNIGNPFGVLDAQNGEHRMAQVASHETAPDTETPRWAKPTAIIVPCDLGDEDKRVMVYDVWHGAAIVGSGGHKVGLPENCSR